MLRKPWPSCSENQVRRIPVVNQEGMLEGMVATADILQRANVSLNETKDVFKKISEPTDQASREPRWCRRPRKEPVS